MDLVPGHIHPYTVIISEDENDLCNCRIWRSSGDGLKGDRQEINTSDGNTITGVEPGDVQWDGEISNYCESGQVNKYGVIRIN